jgi:tRNA C32,U32 (ribose-2'-O)-methylase TrmJ
VVITVVTNLSKAIHERDFFQEKAWGLSFYRDLKQHTERIFLKEKALRIFSRFISRSTH